MNVNYAYYVNEEDDLQRKAELKLERKFLRSRLDPFQLPDREFRRLYRLNKELYQNLVVELTPHLQQGQRSTKLSIDTRILSALRFFATGAYQRNIGNEFNLAISQQSMSNAITEVATALELIAPRWIRFPTDEEHKRACQVEFMHKFEFPGVIGLIDGTHIAILEPLEDEHIYFNRKGFHSKNVQIICDSNLVIMNVNANFGGSAHDPFIWRNSAISRHLEQYYQEGNPRVWLIGDSGYPLQPWLLTPITHTQDNTPERRYDDALTLTRNCVERCIGTWKGRFRCLLKERMLRYDPHKAGLIINACAVLHNMCIRGNLPLDEEVEEEDDVGADAIDINDFFNRNVLQEGRRQRQHVIDLYFTH